MARGGARRGTATIDSSGQYRYWLSRTWDSKSGMALFIMLNPSTADASSDDHTIRRCMGLARTWGYGSVGVVNLYAFRSPHPDALLSHPDPVGPRNDAEIRRRLAQADIVIAAWGAFAWAQRRADKVQTMAASEHEVYTLGTTKAGLPRHPLYVRREVRPEPLKICLTA